MSVQGLQFLCLIASGSLFALTGLRQFFIEPLANPLPNLIWFLLQSAPLLAVLPGMLRMKTRSYLLAALAAMLYFSHGVLLATGATLRVLGLVEVGFAMLLVLFASFAVRALRAMNESGSEARGADQVND